MDGDHQPKEEGTRHQRPWKKSQQILTLRGSEEKHGQAAEAAKTQAQGGAVYEPGAPKKEGCQHQEAAEPSE